ncbi:hypothetical protein FOL47_002055 [Perkinsus chesapeaki]|uniref:Uncharacterized protein n=1 Tax=Perkinsus chesapeaki TaxID=330153 RepID=A0A7J6KQA0_PERCH|nr:hypothetical protein FOL47_002055 [Perkinsus chesapeaki]
MAQPKNLKKGVAPSFTTGQRPELLTLAPLREPFCEEWLPVVSTERRGHNTSNASLRGLGIVGDEPYGVPSGTCRYDGKDIYDCNCPDSEVAYAGIIDGKVGAGMCLPKCNGGSCPAYPAYYWKRVCIDTGCFLPCVLTLAPCPGHLICYDAGLPYSICLHPM